jgi:type I restriction enzyme, S subunit
MNYRLGDICTLTKGSTGIMKAVPGPYPMVALSEERKTHKEYQFDANAVIVPLISSSGHGHASMKRVHYQEGKFALGTILCAVIPKDGKQLDAKFLHLYLQQFKDSLLVSLMKGAANVSLPMNKLADVEVEVPSLKRQKEIIELENEAGKHESILEEKLKLQEEDIKKLHQAFLREAMQGKLVPHDPSDEPASELLKRIKAEKEKLVKEGKIRKEKPLPEIKEEEIPFEVPEGWVWCRLGEIVQSMNNGIYKPDQFYNETGIACLRMYNIQEGQLSFHNLKRMILTDEEINTYSLSEGDLLLNRVNSIELLGKSAYVSELDEPFVYESKNIRVRFVERSIIPQFINLVFLTNVIKNQLLMSFKKVTGQASINQVQLSSFLIPLPPLPAQRRIVAKLTALMSLCDSLEQSIKQSKSQTEMLLQAVLKEALEKN